jgi:hypothetical protein
MSHNNNIHETRQKCFLTNFMSFVLLSDNSQNKPVFVIKSHKKSSPSKGPVDSLSKLIPSQPHPQHKLSCVAVPFLLSCALSCLLGVRIRVRISGVLALVFKVLFLILILILILILVLVLILVFGVVLSCLASFVFCRVSCVLSCVGLCCVLFFWMSCLAVSCCFVLSCVSLSSVLCLECSRPLSCLECSDRFDLSLNGPVLSCIELLLSMSLLYLSSSCPFVSCLFSRPKQVLSCLVITT